jgi:DNA-binding transcriptional regulator YiaG
VSVRELAAALGVSAMVVYDWEAGRRSPSPGYRERYAEGLALLQEAAL